VLSELVSRPDTNRERGIAALLLEESEVATENLRGAVEAHSSDAAAWNDLAVAYLAAARADDDAHAAAAALAAADRALALNPQSEESRFNRAVALDRLQLCDAAIPAYERYLKLDPASSWAAEARERLNRLNAPQQKSWKSELPELQRAAQRHDGEMVAAIVRRHPQEARTWAQAHFCADWGQSILANHPKEAAASLNLAKAIGVALSEANGDSMIRDVVATIEANPNSAALARAHEMFRTVRKTYASRRVVEALPLFRETTKAFTREGSAMALQSRYFEANALHDLHQGVEARSMIEELIRTVPQQYKTLHAELRWQYGTILATSGQLVEAIAAYRDSSLRFESIGEQANAATVGQMLASRYQEIGEISEAWRHTAAAFRSFDVSSTEDVQRVLTGAARGEITHEHWEIARSLIDVVADLGVIHHNARREANLWTLRALSTSHVAPQETAGDIQKAERAAAQIDDAALRDAALFDIRYVTAQATDEPLRAVVLLSENIEWARREQYLTRMPEQYLERCRAYADVKDFNKAMSDFGAALQLIETRGATFDTISRAALQRAVDVTADEIAVGLAEEGQISTAMAPIDRANRVAAAGGHGRPAAERAGLRPLPNETIVHYRSTREQVLIFCMRANRVELYRVRRTKDDVLRASAALLRAVERNDVSASDPLAASLYDDFVRPLRSSIVDGGMLVIVPDGVFTNVPFGALRDPNSNRALIEDVHIVFARSANGYLAAARNRVPTSVRRPLVVADPAFSARALPALQRLNRAGDEGNEIAALYDTTALSGAAATRATVLHQLQSATMFHYAGHAVTNDLDIRNSYLVLAPDEQSSGLLRVGDIEKLDLTKLDAAILAGCRTASSPHQSHHPLGIAAGFLAAGARTVVATIWNADDAMTRRFSVDVHDQMIRGETPIDAVRDVQIAFLQSPDHTMAAMRSWAQFQVWIA
jgi:CHAT domain-containing protein